MDHVCHMLWIKTEILNSCHCNEWVLWWAASNFKGMCSSFFCSTPKLSALKCCEHSPNLVSWTRCSPDICCAAKLFHCVNFDDPQYFNGFIIFIYVTPHRVVTRSSGNSSTRCLGKEGAIAICSWCTRWPTSTLLGYASCKVQLGIVDQIQSFMLPKQGYVGSLLHTSEIGYSLKNMSKWKGIVDRDGCWTRFTRKCLGRKWWSLFIKTFRNFIAPPLAPPAL